MEEIECGHASKDDVYRDFCDGNFVKSHPVLQQQGKETVIQLAFYFDELEVANPLGSKRGKHKLGQSLMQKGYPLLYTLHTLVINSGVFYWMILNIHPAYRSTLHSIQLLAVVKSTILKKYKVDSVLKPVVDDLKALAQYVSYTGVFHECNST